MTRGIFIAGNDSVLFSSVTAEAEKRVEQYVTALIPSASPVTEKTGDSGSGIGRIPLSWNPGSPISCRTLILAAENRLGQINDALLICSPPPLYRQAEALAPADIETLVNNQIKGWFFLVRELALALRVKGEGTISLVVPETVPVGGKDTPADLLGSPAAASFRALAQGLLSSAVAEPFQILGFSLSEIGQEANFAAWLFKILDEGGKKNSGKWHKYSKFTLFR
jgi:hypothetical protein